MEHATQTLLSRDLLVVPHGFVSDLPHQDLHRDRRVVLAAVEHPDIWDGVTVEQLRTLPWVATFHDPTASPPAARQLRMAGVEPRVQVVTETFLNVPALVTGSRRIALMQERLARLIFASAGVRGLPCPLDVGPLIEAMWWHPVNDHDRASVPAGRRRRRRAPCDRSTRGERGRPPGVRRPSGCGGGQAAGPGGQGRNRYRQTWC